MNRFFAFVKKEFLHIIRDVRTMIILIGLPVAMVVIFGYIISNEIKNANIAFLDYSNDNITTQIKNDILASGYFIEDETFSLKQVSGSDKSPYDLRDLSTKYGDIDALFKKGNTRIILVFEENFATKFEREGTANMQLIVDASDPNTATILVGYIQAIVADYQKTLFYQGKESMQISIEPRMMFNEELKSSYMYVPGTIAFILMLICAIMTSVSITREKEFGSMEVLLVTPLKPAQIIIGKLVPYVILSIICSTIIYTLGHFLFEIPFEGGLPNVALFTLLFVLIALLLGLFISSFTKTMEIAMTMSLVMLLLPTLMLSGFIFPIENMPLPLQIFASVLPPRYFLDAIKILMLKGGGIADVYKELCVLIGFIILLTLANLRSIKQRLD